MGKYDFNHYETLDEAKSAVDNDNLSQYNPKYMFYEGFYKPIFYIESFLTREELDRAQKSKSSCYMSTGLV